MLGSRGSDKVVFVFCEYVLHKIWLGFKGEPSPSRMAASMVMISPKLEDNRKSTDF